MASDVPGVSLDSSENPVDWEVQGHRSTHPTDRKGPETEVPETEVPETEVPASSCQDGPQVKEDVPAQEKGADVCSFFLLGKCRFGNGCRLSHSPPTFEDPEAVDQLNRKDEENEGKPKKKKGKGNKNMKPGDIMGKGSSKKPRMRTADDVISRILWDQSVEAADFVVGYVDRFLGMLERPFSEFNWDTDPCDCDFSSELALPRHRIQYFIYNGSRIWDRSGRIDRVFGSTGQGPAPPFGQGVEGLEEAAGTVSQEVGQQHLLADHYEAQQEQEVSTSEGEVSDHSLTKQNAENAVLTEGKQRQTSGAESSPADQQKAGRDSKDGIENDSDLVVLADQISLSQREQKSRGAEGETEEWKDWCDGQNTHCWFMPLQQKGGGQRGGGQTGGEQSVGGQSVGGQSGGGQSVEGQRGGGQRGGEQTGGGQTGGGQSGGGQRGGRQRGRGHPSKMKPTHFITFRADTPSVLSSHQHLREELIRLIPSSVAHWLPASSLHVTLCLLVLPGPAEVTAAEEMLQRFAYLDRNPPVIVSFPLKLKHFGGRVLYLSPQPGVCLQQLNTGLQEAFREQGWLHRDSYNPRYHLTLAKVRYSDGDREVERVFEGVERLRIGKGINFGRLPVNTLHLCSMGMNEDGFYDTLCSVNLR